MSQNRNLLDVRNLGEFAFAMAAYGFVLALVSYVMAFFALELMNIPGRTNLAMSSAVIWLALNALVFRALRQRSQLWEGEQRATKQITYVECTSVVILAALSLAARETVGAHELIIVLEYLFTSWLLSLLFCQVFLHFALGYKIFFRDAVKWSLMLTYTLLNLYTKSS
jgi:hypothetical protein